MKAVTGKCVHCGRKVMETLAGAVHIDTDARTCEPTGHANAEWSGCYTYAEMEAK